MSFGELFFYAIYLGAAVTLAIGAVLGFGLFLQAERSFGRAIIPTFAPLIALGIALGTLTSGRNLTYASISIDTINAGGEGSGGGVFLRIISFIIVGLCGAKIVGFLLSPKSGETDGKPLFLAFVSFFIANAVLNSAFGAHPEFIHNTFYSIIVFAAVLRRPA